MLFSRFLPPKKNNFQGKSNVSIKVGFSAFLNQNLGVSFKTLARMYQQLHSKNVTTNVCLHKF